MRYLVFLILAGIMLSCQYENELDLYYSGEGTDSINADLVAYFPLDGDFSDTSGNNMLLQAYGDPEFARGKDGASQAVVLDGIDDFLVSFIGKLDTFSISMWFLSNIGYASGGIPLRSTFFDYSNKQVYGYIDGISGATQIYCGIKSESVVEQEIEETMGAWYHVCVSVGDDLEMYLDGTLVKIKPIQDTLTYWSDIIYFGRASYDEEVDLTYFNGRLDEIRIYNRTLNVAEVRELLLN